MRACRKCHKLTEKDTCSVCGGVTSTHWSGYISIIDSDNSEIAKKMQIKVPGEYALKVR